MRCRLEIETSFPKPFFYMVKGLADVKEKAGSLIAAIAKRYLKMSAASHFLNVFLAKKQCWFLCRLFCELCFVVMPFPCFTKWSLPSTVVV